MQFKLITVLVIFISVKLIAKNIDTISKEMKEERRVALVIGNKAYQQKVPFAHRSFPVLQNTIHDAEAIKNILSNRGFDVIFRKNLSLKDFNDALEEFYKKLGKGGVGLLYFSGHGMEFDGQNYLIPIDAYIKAKRDIQSVAVPLNKIIESIKQIEKTRLNIVILDACRNDPYAKAGNVGGLAKADPIGLFVAYATGAGQVSSDGGYGGYSLFTQYLIENMKKPLNLQNVFKATSASVYDASEGTQFPAIYDQVNNQDFYFTLPSDNLKLTLRENNNLAYYTPILKVFSKSDINKQKRINASINIENKGVWQNGMKLKKGKYQLTVSAKNYQTQSYIITVQSNKGFEFQLSLIVKKIKKTSDKSKLKTNAELREEGKLIPNPIDDIGYQHNNDVRFDRL